MYNKFDHQTLLLCTVVQTKTCLLHSSGLGCSRGCTTVMLDWLCCLGVFVNSTIVGVSSPGLSQWTIAIFSIRLEYFTTVSSTLQSCQSSRLVSLRSNLFFLTAESLPLLSSGKRQSNRTTDAVKFANDGFAPPLYS